MKLRCITELKHAATFTSSYKCLTQRDADKKVVSLKLLNEKAGYLKYSGFILYDGNNNIVYRYKS